MWFSDNIPIYIQIADNIKEQIVSGKINEGDKLLSVREFSMLYEVTPLTVQRATEILERDGIIYLKKGIGSFAAEGACSRLKKTMTEKTAGEYIQRMKNMGFSEKQIIDYIKKGLEK